MIETVNMELNIGYSFNIAENGVPIGVIIIDMSGNVRCMMFDESYYNRIEPMMWVKNVIEKMIELRIKGIVKIDKLSYIVTGNNKIMDEFMSKTPFFKEGNRWVCYLV
jgi:hypothetical protein